MRLKKKIIFLLPILLCFFFINVKKSTAQSDIKTRDTHYWYQVSIGKQSSAKTDSSAWLEIGKDSTTKTLRIPRVIDTSYVETPTGNAGIVYQNSDSSAYIFDGAKWKPLGGAGTISIEQVNDSTYVIGGDTVHMLTASYIDFDGNRPITRDFSQVTGVNLGTTDIKSTLEQLLFPTQNPNSSLTGTYNGTTATSLTIEKTSASTIPIKLNWTAGRLDFTDSIVSIVVNGQTKVFTQPAAGSSVSGNQTDNITTNVHSTISNVVTTSDNKTSSSFVSINFETKWYYGFVDPSITTPSDADIIGLAGQALTTNRTQNNGNGSDIVVPNSTNRRFVIVQDATLDPSSINQIFVGGLNSTGAFTKTTRNFTNASGFTYQVNVYVLDNTTSGQFNFQIQ